MSDIEMRKLMETVAQNEHDNHSEILKPGTKVNVPFKGKMVPGKIVRFDRKPGQTDAYVVYIGQNASETVPVHKVMVQEAGGIIDKTIAAFGGKGAKGRVDVEKERKHILDGWKEFAGAQGYKNTNEEGFKDFLAYWNFNSDEIDKIIGRRFDLKNSLNIASKMQHRSGKGVTGTERGGPFKQGTPTGDDYESIIKFYTSSLGGNPTQLQMELSAIKKPGQLGNDPLAMLGYAFMKAGSGKVKGK